MSEVNDIIERLHELVRSAHLARRVGWQREAQGSAIEATIEIARLRAELEEAQRERKALLDWMKSAA